MAVELLIIAKRKHLTVKYPKLATKACKIQQYIGQLLFLGRSVGGTFEQTRQIYQDQFCRRQILSTVKYMLARIMFLKNKGYPNISQQNKTF